MDDPAIRGRSVRPGQSVRRRSARTPRDPAAPGSSRRLASTPSVRAAAMASASTATGSRLPASIASASRSVSLRRGALKPRSTTRSPSRQTRAWTASCSAVMSARSSVPRMTAVSSTRSVVPDIGSEIGRTIPRRRSVGAERGGESARSEPSAADETLRLRAVDGASTGDGSQGRTTRSQPDVIVRRDSGFDDLVGASFSRTPYVTQIGLRCRTYGKTSGWSKIDAIIAPARLPDEGEVGDRDGLAARSRGDPAELRSPEPCQLDPSMTSRSQTSKTFAPYATPTAARRATTGHRQVVDQQRGDDRLEVAVGFAAAER